MRADSCEEMLLCIYYVGLEKSDKMKDEKSLDLCGRLEKVEQSAGQVLD